MKKIELIIPMVALMLFGGCSIDRDTDLQKSLENNSVEDLVAGYALFSPTESLIPYPNNILFAPNSSSTNDYDSGKTLNIPYEPDDSDAAIKMQLNSLTGFSIISPITTNITEGVELNNSTLATGVQLYKVEVNSTTGAVSSIDRALTFGIDFMASQSGSKIAIVPLKPLESLTNYMVVLTNSIKDINGKILAPDMGTALTLKQTPIPSDHVAASLEPLRQATNAMLVALAQDGKDPKDTVQIWSFRTQLTGATQLAVASTPKVANIDLTQFGLNMINGVDIYTGELSNLVQFMPQPTAQNPMPILKGQFSYNSGSFSPNIETNITVPLIATVPNSDSNCTKPPQGWSVVIYQHGITRNRTDLLAYAKTFTSKCYASIAMDLPLHGLTETNLSKSPFYANSIERTYNADLVTQNAQGSITAAEPDGVIDSSGTHYINLSHISTTRDNLHQSTSDLLQLQAALASATGVDFDENSTHFLAHSLGTIASTGYLNNASNLKTITLIAPGQGLSQLLASSATYGSVIDAGLSAKGIEPGTAEYASFLLATQTIVDDADPASYTISLGQKYPNNILVFEMVGSIDTNSTAPCQVAANSDNVIPNCVATAPLSGTDPFIRSIGAVNLDLVDGNAGIKPTPTNTAVRFVEGAHSSPLLLDTATIEIHTQLISSIESNATALYVTDPSLIAH